MIKFLKGLNLLGKINLVGDSTAVVNKGATVLAVEADKATNRIIDFRNLFVNTEHRFGLVISKEEVMLPDGSVTQLKGLFSNFKQDTRKVKPEDGDFVELVHCFSGEALITLGHAKLASSYQTFTGIQKSVRDGIATVIVSGQTIKVPTICLKRVPKGIMSETMKKIVDYMVGKGKKPVLLPEYNYMDVTKDGKFIKYISKDRLDRFKGDFWNEELRNKLATQKKLRGVLKAMFDCSDDDMDAVIMLYCDSDLKVEILEGDDIYYAFEEDNNESSGSLGNSCMLDKPSEWFQIYEDNAKIAIVKNSDGLIILRAVLWEATYIPTGEKQLVMDRIYSKNDSMVPLLQGWGLKNGYISLTEQCHSHSEAMRENGKYVDLANYYVQLCTADYEYLPYIDTFYTMVGDRLFASGAVKSAHSTGGDWGTY